MAAESAGNYYVRLDIGENLDVFDLESFLGYRIKTTAGGILPHLLVEFSAGGTLADNLKKELREGTDIKFYEGLDRDDAQMSNWSVTQPQFRNENDITIFRIECLMRTIGYDSLNLTESITGTSIDVIDHLAIHYLGRTTEVLASPNDEMHWALGLSVPQEAMTKTQVRYWGNDSPNTALTLAVQEVGPVIVKDLKMAIDRGPDFEIQYDSAPATTNLPVISAMADYTITPHSAFQSRIGGVNRITGFNSIGPNGQVVADIKTSEELVSPFAGSRIESQPTFDPSTPGRIDWTSMEDSENVHPNWVEAKSSALAQLTRAMDVSNVVAVPENLRGVNLLDLVLFKEQTFDRQLLDTFSGVYFIIEMERIYDSGNNKVTTVLTITKDGA